MSTVAALLPYLQQGIAALLPHLAALRSRKSAVLPHLPHSPLGGSAGAGYGKGGGANFLVPTSANHRSTYWAFRFTPRMHALARVMAEAL